MTYPKTFVGVNNVARKALKVYSGVSGVARKVRKIYAGDSNGKARLCFSGDFWRADGISESNCLAAYRFKGSANATTALTDLTGHGYTMGNNGCGWSSADGFGVSVSESKYLDNGSLRSAGIASIVIKIAGGWLAAGTPLTGGWGGASVWLKMPFEVQSFYAYHYGFGIAHSNGLSVDWPPQYGMTGTLSPENVRISGGGMPTEGVIGFTNSGWGSLFYNGNSVGLNNAYGSGGSYSGPWTRYYGANIPRLVCGTGTSAQLCTISGVFNVEYLAVYNIALSQAQHAAISYNMNGL